MRWHVKKVAPRHKDTRTIYKFAWLPIKIQEYKIWLEFYMVTELWFQPISGYPGWWRPIKTDFAHFYD